MAAISLGMTLAAVPIVTWAVAASNFSHAEWYAARRSDYYLRRGQKLSHGDAAACTQLLGAAVDISPANATVASRVAEIDCPSPGPAMGEGAFRLRQISRWSPSVRGAPPRPGRNKCQNPTAAASSGLAAAASAAHVGSVREAELFATPISFVHLSKVGLKDWRRTLTHLRDLSIRKYNKMLSDQKGRGQRFIHANNHFFQTQQTQSDEAMRHPHDWPEMYSSPEYAEWVGVARRLCGSYLRALGVPLSQEEEAGIGTVIWAAVYPKMTNSKANPVTHYYHAHQETIASFSMYVSVPEPITPLTLSDSRGTPPIEDYEWFQNLGDMGMDGEPPFHRPVEFYAGDGDIVLFPSYQIHKLPPHIGDGYRVVWPCNCELPKRFTGRGSRSPVFEHPLDGWERIARWPVPGFPGTAGARRDAVAAYHAHAQATLQVAERVDDPYMKSWEVQNAVVAMLQFAPNDASVWFDAGNISARIAVVFAASEGSNYFHDAATFLARAQLLDADVAKPSLQRLFQELTPKGAPQHLISGYKEARQLRSSVEALLKGTLPEFMQVQHEDLNGPTRCSRMCPTSTPPQIAMSVVPMFPTRVLIASLSTSVASQEENQILVLSIQMLGEESRGANIAFVPRVNHWWRDQNASLSGVVCDRSASVWFADPRGTWPQRFAGTVPWGRRPWPAPGGTTLGAEPKGPFHWHRSVLCSAREALIFPAWLAHRVAPGSESATRTFVVTVPSPHRNGGVVGWRLPLPDFYCDGAEDSEEVQGPHAAEL